MQEQIRQIIKVIQNNISCPICRRKFLIEEIKIKAIMDNVVVFSVQCTNGHPTIQSLHILLVDKKQSQINNNIVINNIHKEIDNFDGDFIKLWKK